MRELNRIQEKTFSEWRQIRKNKGGGNTKTTGTTRREALNDFHEENQATCLDNDHPWNMQRTKTREGTAKDQ